MTRQREGEARRHRRVRVRLLHLLSLPLFVGLVCRFPGLPERVLQLTLIVAPFLGVAIAGAYVQTRDRFFSKLLLVGLPLYLLVTALYVSMLLRPRCNCSNQSSACYTLRSLHGAQAQFRSMALVDTDGDGDGEFGFLRELGGATGLRTGGGLTASPTFPAFTTSVLGTTSVSGGGIAGKSGYCFLVYLPAADGGWIAESDGIVPGDAVHADAQERRWRCYAWPAAYGSSGEPAFCVDQSGVILRTENHDQAYDGTAGIPGPHAAYGHDGGRWTPARP